MKSRILVVDDDPAMCQLLEARLSKRGYKVTSTPGAEEAELVLGNEDFDVVVTDLNMPVHSGLWLCERIVANRPEVPVIVLTAFGSMQTAVSAIRAGAYDFVTKPIEIDVLCIAMDRAANHRRLSAEVKRLERAVQADRGKRCSILGDSAPIRMVHDLIDRVAGVDSSVLVTGESGTGKELVARAVHDRSERRAAPFVAVNCAALPEALLESELFGHAKGAFTDAKAARTGLLLQAQGGTIFLDEIGEMPLPIQPKLLRVLQDRRVRPVGSDREVPFDARLVTATNRDLETLVEQGRFREDLLFRINVIRIELPPLRSRGGDILLLARHFLAQFAERMHKPVVGISEAAAERLLSYAWPGNVRELQNCVERAVALTRFEMLLVEDLPDKLRTYRSEPVVIAGDDPSEILPMDEVEKRYIAKALAAFGGNKALAARALGFDRKTLYRKIERYRIASGSEPPSGS